MFYNDPYLEFVNQTALKEGKYFLLDSGEGRNFEDPKTGWDIEDLSGWLIPQTEHDRFIESRRNGTADDDFANYYVFAKWSEMDSGAIDITFKKY